jgi:hypothetical protein
MIRWGTKKNIVQENLEQTLIVSNIIGIYGLTWLFEGRLEKCLYS